MFDSTFLYGAQVRANDIRQHYLRYGGNKDQRAERDAVIIVPGITSPAVTWGFVAERFGRQFDTYVLDVRGRGLSEASSALDYSLDAQAADLNAFALALGLSKYAFVGHSMGGRIAIRAASHHPIGLTRVVAVDPPVSGPGRRAYPANLPWYIDSIRMACKGISLEQMREFCPSWSDEQLRLRAQWLHTCDERAIVASFNAFQMDDIHADLPHIAVPLMLMSAERGDVIREEEVSEIRALVPSLHEKRVSNAGHMIPWDNEEGFYQAFGNFLGQALE
ncbi:MULTISPECIES: alpha/beta fold hydrolase [Comamonas]|jgi:N-formylmaleamate deformylase|uniref:alpha/beta fold hydrolase n=1 Tax=Comamonas TaxID=283 RepID=UPI0003692BE3|nr:MULTISPECIES: alpha/beta hydrolase [Comamonas]MCO8252088.1 alpha/beta hydrolase [Comamonas thiooxydans]